MFSDKFSEEVSNKLKYYVYRLIDPRNGDTFYVGKGKGNRVFAHANAEPETGADSDELSDKMQRIREIKNAGFKVAHIIHRHGMNEKTALAVEAALMEAYPGVLNIAGGHGSNEYGCMHAQQVIEQYQARETDLQNHKLLMITINHTATAEDSIYDAVRASWRLNVKKARESEYVLALERGLVVGVFVPTKWLEAIKNNFPHKGDTPGRWGFIGVEAPDDIKKIYMRTRLPDSMRKKGAANPVRYSY